MTRSTTTEALLALLLGTLLVGFGASLSGGISTRPDQRASSYVSDLSGTRALFDILREIGAQPQRLRNTIDTLPDTDRTLVVCAPSEPFTTSDVERTLDWVAAGGRLVIAATSPQPPLITSYHRPILEAVGLRTRSESSATKIATVQPGSGPDASVLLAWPAVLILEDAPPGTTPDPRSGAAAPLVTTGAHRLAVRVPFGDAGGEIIVLADETLLSNRTLREAENAAFVVELLLERERDDTRVVFDELHHGYLPIGEREGLALQAARLLVTTWPGRGVLVGVLAFLVLLWGRGVRLGAPIAEPPPRRRELSEHADALGGLLEGARARGAALRTLESSTRRVVAARAGLARSLSAAEFRTRLAQSPADGAAELAAALERAATVRPGKDGELTAAARELAIARRRYLHGGT